MTYSFARGLCVRPMHAWEGTPAPAAPDPEEYPEEIKDILREIQAYIFTRRIRTKDFFLDYDPLRCGRCTPNQFVRGLNSVAPQLKPAQMKTLTEFFSDPNMDVMMPQVRHLEFIRAVDGVFGAFHLEKQPSAKVPRPGHCLKLGDDINPCDDEAMVEQTLRRLALLVKTRGVIFAKCFQDAERSLDTSLLCPRFAGKVTESQFYSHFPFVQDISENELNLILQRYYSSDSGGINYMAMDRELTALMEETESLASARSTSSRRPRYTAKSPMGGLRLQGPQDQEQLEAELLAKLKAEVAARRLRLHGCFQEVDRLRRGAVTMGQARTVFTILRIELDSKELDMLQRMFAVTGLFNYRELCNMILEVPLDAPMDAVPLSPISIEQGPPYLKRHERVRQRHVLQPDAEELLAEAEMWIARRAEQWTINVKSHFLDFDRLRSSRVTRSQFLRIMDMLQMGLNEGHLQVLMEAYCDSSKDSRDFSYLDLCNSLEKRTQEMHNSARKWRRSTPEPSKYFTRKGKVIPLRQPPLSARCARPATR
ncbi:unnamed protein product [Effrenium voratum]|uniref:EF-hand domain-containing protein n=1 Tax=Effrenium voratum TaxID=2562239 RepID=A0AA36JN73_9DINO|nr:unnamed protein product [Effrenium voratum]CAJ1415748.1 unnamed protein product [Effrenium voratum]